MYHFAVCVSLQNAKVSFKNPSRSSITFGAGWPEFRCPGCFCVLGRSSDTSVPRLPRQQLPHSSPLSPAPHRCILDHFPLVAIPSSSVLNICVHPSSGALHLSAFFSRLDARMRSVCILGHGHFSVLVSTTKQPSKAAEARRTPSLEWSGLVITWPNLPFWRNVTSPFAH